MEEEDVSNMYRDAYKNHFDEIFDDEVVNYLKELELYEALYFYHQRKHYGRYLLKLRRDY